MLEKLYEKASGSKPSKVIDEDMSELPDEIAAREKDQIERDARRLEEEDVEETYSTPTYEEDDVEVSEEMSELPDVVAAREKYEIERDARRLEESNNEEINRFRKLAGLKIRN